MRLSSFPNLPEKLVAALNKCGIRTEADLLFSSGSTLDLFRRLPPETTTIAELDELKETVAELAAAPAQSAAEMLKSYTDDDDLLSGLPRFDQFLSGLTGKRRVLEISGERASGKTFLVLHLVLRYLVDTPSASVLWIDTTSDFSVSWAAEILSGLAGSEPSDALDRLQICQAFEVETVFQALDTVPTSVNNLSNTPSMRVVVIDTVTTLLSPLLSPMPQGHAIMTALMRQLRVVARNATVFVINDTVAVDAKQPKIRKPALGPSFTFMTDATLWLASVGDRGEDDGSTSHVVQLYRTKITAAKALSGFKIGGGVRMDEYLMNHQ